MVDSTPTSIPIGLGMDGTAHVDGRDGTENRNGDGGQSCGSIPSATTLRQGGGAVGVALLHRRPDKGAVNGEAVTSGGIFERGGGTGGVNDRVSSNGGGEGVDGNGAPAVAKEGGPRGPPPPHPQNNGVSRSPLPAIPRAVAAGSKPVLAEWMKDGSMDDSDADTANSLPGGTPSSKSSSFSSAAAATAAAAVAEASALAEASGGAGLSSTWRSISRIPGSTGALAAPASPVAPAPAAPAGPVEETLALPARPTGGVEGHAGTSAAGAPAGEERNGRANGAGVGTGVEKPAWRLADWIKEGGVDDSDVDTNASG